jgi:hypothetical protein
MTVVSVYIFFRISILQLKQKTLIRLFEYIYNLFDLLSHHSGNSSRIILLRVLLDRSKTHYIIYSTGMLILRIYK